MSRAALALLAFCTLTAFAPAPFPKYSRRDDGQTAVSLHLFQGKWRSVKLEDIKHDGARTDTSWQITAVRVKDDLWTFLNKGDAENAKYRLTIDGTRKPATIDFYSEGVNRGRTSRICWG